MVAYNDKHNQANGENNNDGSNDNNSWNCGWEGDVGVVPQPVMDLRLRQARNLATILLLANGTPMFVAGDEFLHTQGGNNNPYNQDNATAWLDWTRLTAMQPFHDFMTTLIAFRKGNPAISRSRFWRSDYEVFGFDGNPVNYGDTDLRYFAYHLLDSTSQGNELYVMINAYWQPMSFAIAAAGSWKQIINTYLPSGQDIILKNTVPLASSNYLVGERSVVVLSR